MNIHGIQSVGTLTQQAGGYATLSGSFTGSFKGDGSQLTGITATVDSSSLLTTASFNTYTASTNSDLASIHAATASLQTQLATIGTQSGSWGGSSVDLAPLNQASASLQQATASLQVATASLNTFTASANVSISNLNIATASLNTFSASANVSITNLNSTTASLLTSVANINTFTSSANQRLTAIEAVSGSWITESETGSFAVLGANQQFTGANTFIGNTVVSQSAAFGTASFYAPVVINNKVNVTGNATINGNVQTNKLNVFDFDSLFLGSQIGGTTANGTFFGYGSTDYTTYIGAYGAGFDNELQIYVNNAGIEFRDFNGASYPSFLKLLPNSGGNPKPIMTRGLEVTGSTEVGTFTASLQQGYVWVGNGTGRTTTVATSSFAVNTSTFATTGSNTFIGTESISGSLRITGSAYGNVVSMSISANTASMDLSAGNYFELTSSVTPVRINVTNVQPGVSSTLIISASASSSILFSTNVAQPSGNAYSGSAGSIDVLSFVSFNTSKINVVATKALI